MTDNKLDQLLRTTNEPLPTAPGFQRDVWLRIEAAESAGWKPALNRRLERFFGFLGRPSAAIATCAAMIMAGAWLGLRAEPPNQSGETAYVQAVSPFAHNHRR